MSWRAQNRSEDAKTPSAAPALSEKPELDCCPIQHRAYEPRTRAISAPGRQPPVRTNSVSSKEKGQSSQPRCRSGSGSPATETSGPEPQLDPLDHIQPNTNTAPPWAQGVPGGATPLVSLIAQLVDTRASWLLL
jgi:hypothetical protein